jgi:hypothetical protein
MWHSAKPSDILTSDSDVHNYIEMTEAIMPVIMIVSVLPWLSKIMMSWLFKAVRPSEKDQLGFAKFMGWVVSYDMALCNSR